MDEVGYFRLFYFALPKGLRYPMKRLINIKKKQKKNDKECFRWCLVRYLYLVNKNLAKIRNINKEFGKQLDFIGVKCPVYKKDYAKTEKQNNISANVFGFEDETLHRIYT